MPWKFKCEPLDLKSSVLDIAPQPENYVFLNSRAFLLIFSSSLCNQKAFFLMLSMQLLTALGHGVQN